jgi:hypothetical protein
MPMPSMTTLDEATRALRLLFVAWVAFALVGTFMPALLMAPALRFEAMPVERADFVGAASLRVGFGAWLFAARGLGEVLAATGLFVFARRLPYQPGLVAAAVAICASLAALFVDASAAHLYATALPDAARAASGSAGALDVPDLGGGFLGALADIFEEIVGYGRGQAIRDYVRVEALGLRRAGALGSVLHLAATIALYASAASFVKTDRAPSLTGAAGLTVVGYATAAGAFYAAVSGAVLRVSHLHLGFGALVLVALSTVWLAGAVGARVVRARDALRDPSC